MQYYKHARSNPVVPIGVSILLVIIAIAGFNIYAVTQTDDLVDCVVTEKDRARGADGEGSDARVYTENCGVLRVGDSLLDVTMSSADTYASIKVGETYDFSTRGIRFGLFSMFPNIITAEEKVS